MKQTSMHICTLDSPVRMNEHVSYTNSHIACPHARIISDSATIIRRFRNQNQIRFRNPKKKALPQPKKDASATKNRRFRNQKKTIPQPKKDDSATKIRAIRKPKSASLCNQDPCCYTLRGIVSKCGGVGWGGTKPFLQLRQLRSFFWNTCSHTQHGIVSRCGGVGWGGVGWGRTITSLQLRSLLDIRAVTLNGVGWGGVGWGGGQ